ncbi:MAG: hypothetical protein J07AB43_03890 [Candidatus Nanosalina sp. J07AB43]|nr:MAG: hypothetical protein J07AB43_03890 [Candidatus Nanosalina sp. J07AB43]
MFSAEGSPIQEFLMDDSEDMQQPVTNDSEDSEPPGYYDKASDEEAGSADAGGEDTPGSDEELNVTEQAEVESSFDGYVRYSERDDGVFLTRKAVAGELSSAQVYADGNPVEGAEIVVNGEDIGQTPSSGSLIFEVPDADQLVLRTTTENLGTVEETYEVY